MNLSPFFNQYLRTTMIPELHYEVNGPNITYRYDNIVPGFRMPVRIFTDRGSRWLYPSANWKTEVLEGEPSNLRVDPNFYIKVEQKKS
jgi:hypothetical protein